MGFYVSKLMDTKLEEYIGSNTMHSCADNGAFNSTVSSEVEKYVNEHQNVYAAVDSTGIEHFLETLRSGRCQGRDIQMLIDAVSTKYLDGFMISG
jgi:hypothetical protein